MTTMELRKQIEDEIAPILEYRPLKLSIIYNMLRKMGYTSDGLDYRIEHLLRMECADPDAAKRC